MLFLIKLVVQPGRELLYFSPKLLIGVIISGSACKLTTSAGLSENLMFYALNYCNKFNLVVFNIVMNRAAASSYILIKSNNCVIATNTNLNSCIFIHKISRTIMIVFFGCRQG